MSGFTELGTAAAEKRGLSVDGADTIALDETLEYFRALQILERRTVSPRSRNVVLDDEVTAVRAAETGLWWPVNRRRKSTGWT
ncbi:hypothetical protein [Amycolatopsis magusensis]|uniref:hypothetical protein n=1 Tax=Amycolatopsis magusensis TaxID=882444 RepID=UPI0035567A81